MTSQLALADVDTLPPETMRQTALSQWFTPADVALKFVRWLGIGAHSHVLEPSAGKGALVRAMLASAIDPTFDAVELDPRFAADLGALGDRMLVDCCDYLTRPAPPSPYDYAVMNPPYEDGQDSAFVAKAMDESVRVGALLRLAMLETARAHERVWSRVDSGEWCLVAQKTFVARPVFDAPGSSGGMTAFMTVKLVRADYADRATRESVTHMGWW